MGNAGRPKGSKNKRFHKSGGDRRSPSFKAWHAQRQESAVNVFKARAAANQQTQAGTIPVSHPQSETNLLASRNLLWAELQHPSMPQGRNLPSFCAADATDETVWNDKEQYDDGIDYHDDNEDDNDDVASTKFRQSYMPPPGTPLETKLASIQKQMMRGPMRMRWSVPESSPMSAGLGNKPAPNAFYENVKVRNWNVKAQYAGLQIEYCCISCGEKNLKLLGTRYRPAFGWSTIEWVVYERFSCQNNACKGGKKNKGRHCCFSTIDPAFIAQLPTVVARDFEYVFPASGPGVLLEMASSFLHFTDQHVLFSAFANTVNSMHREHYYKCMNQYYHLLNQWLDVWPRLDSYKGVPPLHANNYKGTPMVPYSAFGRTGYHNGIVMTPKFAKTIFIHVMEIRERYMQASFQAWHDEGMSIDDTHKLTKKIFVNTSGRSRVSPFTATQTNLSKIGKIIASRFKFTKSHAEVKAIVAGIKDSREKTSAPPLAYLAFDNPEGDGEPYEEAWGNDIGRGVVPFEKCGGLPRLELLELRDFVYFSCMESFGNFVMTHWDDIEKADKHVGLDTEFDRHTHELYVISVSISTLPVIVLHMVGLDGLPSEMEHLLKREEFIFCGRQAGGDCNKIEQQHGVSIKHRLELGTLALRDRPEMARIKGGTTLASLVESYLGLRCPIDKDIGQNADYSTKTLSSDLKLYAAADAYCHRVVAIAMQKSLANKHAELSFGPRTIDNGVVVRLNFRGKVVAEGSILFHGSSGRQMRWGSRTLGKNDSLIRISKVVVSSHVPSHRYVDKLSPENEWPQSATTLGQLWDSEHIQFLDVAWPLCNLTVVPSMQGGAALKEPVQQLGTNTNNKGQVNEDNNEKEYDGDRLHTRKLRDIFHQFHSLPLPRKNLVAPTIFRLIMLATWIKNDEDLEGVIATLAAKGVDDVENHEYYNRSYWNDRIRRATPPAAMHAQNVRAVMQLCIANETLKAHMTEKVVKWFETFEHNAAKGMYHTPDDVPQYICIGQDADGLNLYRSTFGTNLNENLHQKYADLVGPFAVGVQVAHYLTLLRSYRYNISIGISRAGEPDFVTDRHELVDEAQHWIIRIFGVMAWPGHRNLLDFEGSNDFVPVGVGKLPLDPELVHFGPPMNGMSDDYFFMCKRMQVVLAPLPPSTAAEYKLFHIEIGRVAAQNKVPTKADFHRIARNFLEKSDGKVIFPKTVEMLHKHYISWKFNQRIKALQKSVVDTVESLSGALAKQRAPAPAVRTFKLPQKPSMLLNSMMEHKTNFVAPEQALPNSCFVSATITVPILKKRTEPSKQLGARFNSLNLDSPVLDMTSLAKACAWFPHCTLQRAVCGGTNKALCCVFGGKDAIFSRPMLTQEEALEIKRKRTADTRRANRKKKCLPEQKAIQGPNNSSRGGVIVTPVDMMPLTESGSMIGDNVVLAYLNMLCHQQPMLRRLAPQFLPTLMDHGWQFVSRWMRDTGVIGGGWDASRLIFIPGFLGPRTAGHWLPIIIDRQFEEGETFVIIGDSLGPANFGEVRERFRNTPFEGAEFRYLGIPSQADGSNDCAVFMMLVFAAWLKAAKDRQSMVLELRLEKCGGKEFGERGRKHILESICNGRIDLNDEVITSLTFK